MFEFVRSQLPVRWFAYLLARCAGVDCVGLMLAHELISASPNETNMTRGRPRRSDGHHKMSGFDLSRQQSPGFCRGMSPSRHLLHSAAKAVVIRGQRLRLQPADHLTQLLFAEFFGLGFQREVVIGHSFLLLSSMAGNMHSFKSRSCDHHHVWSDFVTIVWTKVMTDRRREAAA
jgi:hypothetical protein